MLVSGSTPCCIAPAIAVEAMVHKNSSMWTHEREELACWAGSEAGIDGAGGTTGDTVLRQKFKGLRFLAGG